MADRIGVLRGTLLSSGVSRNGRLYTKEHLRAATEDLQNRIDSSGLPIQMYSHHDSKNVLDVCGRITATGVGEDGSAWYEADIPDTRAGRDIKALTVVKNGKRYLDSVSFKGYWDGPERIVEHNGQAVTTGDRLVINRIDFTGDPGVLAARIDTADAAETAPSPDTVEQVPDGCTAITEDAPDVEFEDRAEISETGDAELVDDTEVTEAKTPPMSKRDSGLSGTGGPWADPGYQSDKKQRYQLSTASQVKAAWSFINQAKNQEPYTAAQVNSIKKRIKAAAKTKGVTIASESRAAHMAEFGEAYLSISASNGPADVTVSAYGVDNADLDAAGGQLGKAAKAAVTTLDPDLDDDFDLPDGDEITCSGCGAEMGDGDAYCSTCGTKADDDEGSQESHERKAAPVAETDQTPSGDAEPAADTTASTPPETPQAPEQPQGEGDGEKRQDAAPVVPTLTAKDLEAIAALLAPHMQPVAAGAPAESAPDADTIATKVSEAVAAQVDGLRKEMVERYGTPPRKGLTEAAQASQDKAPEFHKMSPEEWAKHQAQAWDAVLNKPATA